MVQIHKRFTDEDIKYLLEKYLSKEIEIDYILEILDIKKTRFFELLKEYRNDKESFSLKYIRCPVKKISEKVGENIVKELEI